MTRALWYAAETIHDVVYFAPEAKTAFEDIGLRGWRMGYFASRAAAMGAVDAQTVTTTFHGFAPAMVERAIPDAWSRADVETIRGARGDLAAFALRRALGPTDGGLGDVGPLDLVPVIALTSALVAGCSAEDRPLAAAHAALPRPVDALRALWYDCTVLREYRGDGHVAALVAAGLDGCAANVLMRGLDLVPARQQSVRGWSDEEWSAAREGLQHRGFLDDVGMATDAGRLFRAAIEDATDAACEEAESVLDAAQLADLTVALVDLAQRVAASGAVAYPNPVGTPAP